MKMVALLIQYQADVNQSDGYDKSPLIYAAIQGNLEIIKLLLKNGANLTHQDDRGRSAHDHARMHKHHDVGDYFVMQLLYLG